MPQHKLLLADDSVTIQKVVNLTFADEGIEVITVGDGDSAIRQLTEFSPDLVMADVNMPGLNGYQVCERIRQNPETAGLPVILLVGSFEPFDEEEARRVGASDHMTKPFQSIRQLVNKVNDLLSAAGGVSPETALEETAPETPEAFGEDLEPAVETAAAATVEIEPASTVEEPAGDMHAATLEMERQPVDYGDAGMDDEMIEASSASGFSEPAAEDHLKTRPLDAEDLKEFALVGGDLPESGPVGSEPTPGIAEAAEEVPVPVPVSIDESNLLDLPPLVEETGIRPAFEAVEPEPMGIPMMGTEVSDRVVEDIAGRVADKLAEKIVDVLDTDSLREIVTEVMLETRGFAHLK